MKRMNATRPLIWRQMKILRWFIVGFLVVCAFELFMVAVDMNGAVNEIWQRSSIELYNYHMPLNVIGNHTIQMLLALGVLSALMAMAQQVDALNHKNAQLLGAMPVTRKESLLAQLIPALAIITLTTFIFGLGESIIMGSHIEMLNLGARISAIPEALLVQNTILLPIIAALRLMVLTISIYLCTSAIMGLFGNVWAGVGFIMALLFLWFVYLIESSQIFYRIQELHEVNPELMEMQIRVPLLTMFGSGVESYQRISPNSDWPIMPWDRLGLFLIIHAALWLVSLVALTAERRNMAIEKLGSPMLFSGTRWAVIAYGVAWTLLIPLLNMTTYDPSLRGNKLNPYLPLLFIPAALVVLVGWLLLIRRPARKARLRAIPALLLILSILITPHAFADDGSKRLIKNDFTSSMVNYDQPYGERLSRLTTRILDRIEKRYEATADSDGWYETSYDYDDGQINSIDWNNKQALLNYDNYISAADSFADNLVSFGLGKDIEEADAECTITANELAEDLRAEGYDALAAGCVDVREAALSEDGLWLIMTAEQYPDGNGELVYEYTHVQLCANTPFTIKGADLIDAAVLSVPNMRRTTVFANSTFQTISYTMIIDESIKYYYQKPVLQVILKNGIPYKLMLSASLNFPEIIAAMEDAKAALTAIEQLVGTKGTWIESADPVFTKLSRIMVSFGE